MSQITLTVPLEKKALLRASEMLSGLAADYATTGTLPSVKVCDKTTVTEAAKNVAEVVYQNQKGPEVPLQLTTPQNVEWVETRADDELTAEQVFGGNAAQSATVPPVQPAATASTVPAPVTNDNPLPVAPPVTEPAVTTSTNTTTATASNVELDSEGLPWDARIHSSSKAKLAKGGGWKLKRGLDEAFVEQIKAELRAVMSILPVAPAVQAETQGLHPNPNPLSVSAVNAIAAASNPTPPAPTSAGPITTFAQLMPAITKAGISQDTIKAVLASIDPSLTMPLLATRMDLIPQVAVALGL